jgi:MoaA/NifB/PqqE/SkfB family radical SAM enzyme
MDLYRTGELAITLGAAALSYNRLNLGAYNQQFADQLLPSPAMIRENLDVLESLGEKYGVPIIVAVVIEPCVVDIRTYKHIQFGWCPLGGEGSYFAIDPIGDVRICNHSPTILGNIRRESSR